MIKPATNSIQRKSKSLVFFEYIALVISLSVIALRTTITEGLSAQSTNLPFNLSNTTYSLAISGLLIFSFLIWFVWNFCSRQFFYRVTAIEFGLLLFLVAAVISGINAPDKRAAITDFACMLAPILMAVMLIQILDSHAKIKIILIVIAALGVVSAYQAADQLFTSNKIMIEQYEQNPQSMLEPLGIQTDSLNHFLFEHRIYSRGNRAFFTTRNSAGSFFLLSAFAAIALLIEKIKTKKSQRNAFSLITHAVVAAFILFGLAITKSKGAIAGLFLTAIIFVALLRFGNWIKIHRKLIATVCVLAFVVAASALVFYGLTGDKLPGGNSMLVRWQYWTASAKMFADHPFAGVGPANFANLYTHYKPAAALETISDPHSFPLTMLTQYGPLGLLASLGLLLVPLYKSLAVSPDTIAPKTDSKKLFAISIAATVLALLLIRPILIPIAAIGETAVIVYVAFVLYVTPVVIFAIAVWLLTAKQKLSSAPLSNVTASALFCAALAVLIHNLIDFAIFEPPVYTAFWAIVACIIAINYQQNPRPAFALKTKTLPKIFTVAAVAIITFAYFNYAFVPVTKTANKINLAQQAASKNQFQKAHELLNTAADDDRLSTGALSLNSKIYLKRYRDMKTKQTGLLLSSRDCSLEAINRNSASFKNYERLTKIYILLADSAKTKKEKADWLAEAFDSAQSAVERYPDSARIRFALAATAEKLNETELALTQYEKTVQIEDAFRAQFKKMYPDRKIVSRLGQQKYRIAKNRIESLSK